MFKLACAICFGFHVRLSTIYSEPRCAIIELCFFNNNVSVPNHCTYKIAKKIKIYLFIIYLKT
jgi:hypothetical protein